MKLFKLNCFYLGSEKHEAFSSLPDSRAISASDDTLNESRRDDHEESNPDSEKKHSLSPLTRRLSSSVPDLCKKQDKK